MKEHQTETDRAQVLQEYRDVIRDVRNALDEMEKEIEEKLGLEETARED